MIICIDGYDVDVERIIVEGGDGRPSRELGHFDGSHSILGTTGPNGRACTHTRLFFPRAFHSAVSLLMAAARLTVNRRRQVRPR